VKTRTAVGLLVMGILAASLVSCKSDPANTRLALSMAGKEGALLGLKQWAKKDAPAATECAVALRENITKSLLPYLDGGKLPSSSEIQAAINSTLFKKVPDEVKDTILTASLILDSFLPVPGADTYLNADQVGYLKAFLTGLSDGCDAFTSKAIEKPRNWLK